MSRLGYEEAGGEMMMLEMGGNWIGGRWRLVEKALSWVVSRGAMHHGAETTHVCDGDEFVRLG